MRQYLTVGGSNQGSDRRSSESLEPAERPWRRYLSRQQSAVFDSTVLVYRTGQAAAILRSKPRPPCLPAFSLTDRNPCTRHILYVFHSPIKTKHMAPAGNHPARSDPPRSPRRRLTWARRPSKIHGSYNTGVSQTRWRPRLPRRPTVPGT